MRTASRNHCPASPRGTLRYKPPRPMATRVLACEVWLQLSLHANLTHIFDIPDTKPTTSHAKTSSHARTAVALGCPPGDPVRSTGQASVRTSGNPQERSERISGVGH